MSQDEVFDVYNEQMHRIGEAFMHTSIIGEISLILQLRHKDKDTFPNLLDISCAGH
jgi:chromosomal replication initiation ATPase DnaA